MPDITFQKARVLVYLDGCFWHGCPVHATTPARNADYWVPKLEANKQRDRRVTAELLRRGWTVLRYWEHDNPAEVAQKIGEIVRANQIQLSKHRDELSRAHVN